MILQNFIVPIIKVTDSCNFTCEFCYYAQNKNLEISLMDIELCKKIILESFNCNYTVGGRAMRIIFHGGEPLLQNQKFYQHIIDYEKTLTKNVSDEFIFYHSVQTNGFLINDDWIDFFRDNKFDVGISIDGDKELNFHYGYLGVEKTTKTVLANYKKLQKAGISCAVISVITNKHVGHAKNFYNFCVNNEIHDVSLNYCFNKDTKHSVKNKLLAPFLEELFDLYFDGAYALNIREFNEMIAKISGYRTDTCGTCDRQNCGQYLSFDSKGDVYFCDSCHDSSKAIGNIYTLSLRDIIDSTAYLSQLLECREMYEQFCQQCVVRDYCGGGCHRHDLKRGNKHTSNYFCETYKKLSHTISKRIKL